MPRYVALKSGYGFSVLAYREKGSQSAEKGGIHWCRRPMTLTAIMSTDDTSVCPISFNQERSIDVIFESAEGNHLFHQYEIGATHRLRLCKLL